MRGKLSLLSAVFGGMLGGLASAHFLMEGLDAGEGPWRIRQAEPGNPYALARQMLDGRLPVPPPAYAFEYARDADGAALDADCTYAVTGRLPPYVWWSLSAAEGTPGTRPSVITPHDMVFERDGRFRIAISREPQPGNWIMPMAAEAFVIRMKLLPGARFDGTPRGPTFSVARGACQ